MRKTKKRVVVGGLVAGTLVALVGLLWISLNHQPKFYRTIDALPPEARRAEAERFVKQSFQLCNDISNEPRWEAVFTDQEVNAWLAEHLVRSFADLIPAGVHEPRVAFDLDRVTLAFQFDHTPLRSVVWVVLRVRVAEPNTLALTLEKVRAGVVPISAQQVLDKLAEHARRRGLEVRWEHDGDLPVALVAYSPAPGRRDVVLEQLQVIPGKIRLAGRSDRTHGVMRSPTLPRRIVLQSTFSRRNVQDEGVVVSPVGMRRNVTSPAH